MGKDMKYHFNLRLNGRITKQIALSWYFFMVFSNTFWGLFFWGIEDKGHTVLQHLSASHFVGFLSLSSILLTLHLLNPAKILFRALLITFAGMTGLIIALLLIPVVTGMNMTQNDFIDLVKFISLIGFLYYTFPLFWQWREQCEKPRSHHIQKNAFDNYIAGLSLTGKITFKITLRWIKVFSIACTALAINGWVSINSDISFYQHLIFNYCVGFCSLTSILLSLCLINPRNNSIRLLMIFGFGNLGMSGGMFLASRLSGIPLTYTSFAGLHFFYSLIGFVGFGSIFYWQWRIKSNEKLNSEKIRRLKLQKEVEKNKLMALQTQMEPEFLFQTLSDIQELLLTDPEKGKAMQLSLIQYLRASLSKINIGASPINQQMGMLKSYYDIHSPRLQSNVGLTFDIPKHLMHHNFPPMLIQPMVENAIKKRVSAAISGGEISIRVEEEGNLLRVVFKDNKDSNKKNRRRDFPFNAINKRIKQLFGNKGQLIFNENTVSGFEAVIEVPQVI